MPTNDTGNTDAQEGAEDKSSDNNNDIDDVLSSIEDEDAREEVRNKIVSEREKKKHWRGKAQSSDNADADSDSSDNQTEESPDKSDQLSERLDKIEENQELAREGYSDQEIAEARAYAKGKDMSTQDAMETEFVQGAIERMREKNQSQEDTPGPSSRTEVQGGKAFNEIVSDDDMSKQEKNEALQELVDKKAGKGRSSME